MLTIGDIGQKRLILIYNYCAGAMSPREEWLNRVLANAELDRANYMSTVGRIKALESNAKQVSGKLLRRFHDLREILEG